MMRLGWHEHDAGLKKPRKCDHDWQIAGMVFETQLLDEHGRVRVRQPDIDEGRVYLVCLRCASHTYQATEWVGYRLHGSDDRNIAARVKTEGGG